MQEFTEHFRKLSIRQMTTLILVSIVNEELNMDLTKEEVCRINP